MAKESYKEYAEHETPEDEVKEGHSAAFLEKAKRLVEKKHGKHAGKREPKRMEKK